MKALQDIKLYCGIFGMTALLCSCSSAVFPDITEDEEDVVVSQDGDEDSSFIGRKSKKIELSMPEEGESLQADTKNVAYDNEKPDIPFAAKTKPVKKEELKESKAEAEKALSENTKKKEEKSKKIDIPQKPVISAADFAANEEENAIPSVSYRLDTFYFANGSSSLDSQYNKQIRNIVKLAKSKKNSIVTVKGYASSRTRNTDPVSHKLANFKVSAARAQSVAEALKRYGLPASKIQTEALSDSMPAYQEVMTEGERLNRRVDVYIAY